MIGKHKYDMFVYFLTAIVSWAEPMTVKCDSENIKFVMNETVPTAEISNRE